MCRNISLKTNDTYETSAKVAAKILKLHSENERLAQDFLAQSKSKAKAKQKQSKSKSKAKQQQSKSKAKAKQMQSQSEAKAKQNIDLSQKLFNQIQQGYKVQLKGTFE